MTAAPTKANASSSDLRPSLLPFDPDQLTAIRVRPVEFARLCGVSRQAVSKWIKKGLFSVGPDGRFDPAIAWRQVLSRSDPARLRTRIFKDAIAPVAAQRARIRALEAEVADVRQKTENRCCDEAALKLEAYMRAIVDSFDSLVSAQATGRLASALDRLAFAVFYGRSPEDYEDYEVDDCDNQHPDPSGHLDSRETPPVVPALDQEN